MKYALQQASKSSNNDEVPVGCVIVNSKGVVISSAVNSTFKNNDPTAHAEIIAIRKACQKLKTTKLSSYSLYVTLQPCQMCEAAIIYSGIKKVFFGAYSESLQILKEKKYNYHSESNGYQIYGGIHEQKCSELLKKFFKKLR